MKIIERTLTYATNTHSDVAAYVLEDGHTYNFSEWNGETWSSWWDDDNGEKRGDEAVPVYRFQAENVDIFLFEEDSAAWNYYNEIVAIELI